jgi:glutathione peroxidase
MPKEKTMSILHDFSMKTIQGDEKSLGDFKGQVTLVVNVASACGLTPQYEGLEALQKKYGAKGFSVLGFPCNQFAGQEPGTDAEVATFCETKFGVTFPMFSKIDVNGDDQTPLYAGSAIASALA